MLPLARPESDDLVVKMLLPETLIFDIRTYRAVTLNAAATLLWRRCDGQTSIAALAQALRDDLGLNADEETVWAGLEELQKESLLDVCPPIPTSLTSLTKRRLRRRLIVAGSVTFLSGILVPEASAAGSCVINHADCTPKDGPCSTDTQCCSCKCTGSGKCQ